MVHQYAHGTSYGPPVPAPPTPGPPPPPVRPRAPFEVHVVAVLQYLTSLALLCSAAVIVVARYADGQVAGTYLPESYRAWGAAQGLPIAALTAVGALAALVIGRRLHRGRQWARVLVLALSVASLGFNVFTLVTEGYAEPLTGLVLPILYLVLLLGSQRTREFFRYRGFH